VLSYAALCATVVHSCEQLLHELLVWVVPVIVPLAVSFSFVFVRY